MGFKNLHNPVFQESSHVTSNVRKSIYSEKAKDTLAEGLNQIEAQICYLRVLIETETYCDNFDELIKQITTSQVALDRIAKILFEAHLKDFALLQIQDGNLYMLDKMLITIQKLMKK